VPVGGNGLIDGSLELRFPIGGNWSGATFLDFGDVRLSAAESLNVANLQYAAGVGIRYNTLFGPVRIDVASKLPKPSGRDVFPGVQVVDIRSSGQAVPIGIDGTTIVSLHISVGEAF
jgi:translocation and assembly module TamA